MQALLFILLAVNIVSVQLELRYYRLAGEPLHYWRSQLTPASPEFERLTFWSSVASYTTVGHLLAGFLTFLAVFLVTGWKRRLFLIGSVALCVLALIHQVVFATSLD